jgi:signal transduction histidine kinase
MAHHPIRSAVVSLAAAGMLLGTLAAAQPVATLRPDGSLPLLTEIQAIRALSQDLGALAYPVRLRGTVTHFDEIGRNSLILHDGSFGQFVSTPEDPAAVGLWDGLRTGDLIEIEGVTERGGFAPNIRPSRIRKLGQGPLPKARTIPFSAMLTGRYDCDYVEIEGVVQRAWLASDDWSRPMFAEVATEEGPVRALFWRFDERDVDRFIDARVRLRGNVGTIFGETEQLRGVSLFAGRTSDVVLLEPAPDPFELPRRHVRGIYHYSSAGEVNRRIGVRGVVTAVVPGHPVEMRDFTTTATFRYVLHVLYLKDETGGLRIETEQEPAVVPGDIVEAAGFPAVTPGRPVLRNAVFRVRGRGSQPAPLPIDPEDVLTPDHDAEVVRIDGELLSVMTGPDGRTLVLRAADTVFNAGLIAPGTGWSFVRPGSLVSVAGVYAYQPGPPPSFRLVVRSPDDVQVLAEAPWWTMRHTVVMVLMLTFVAVLGALGMRTQSRRRRREYQAVLSERTRVARELHDTLEQGLAGIALQLEAVAGSLQRAPERAGQSLDVARQMLRYSLEETRRSIMDLRSQALEALDLPGALTSLAQQMTIGTAARAQVHVVGTPQRLDAAEEHHLLRIGLEALTNALKHASPGRIDIYLRFEADGTTTLEVCDDGRGLPPRERGTETEHFGLQGIRERVVKLGGTLRIESQPGKGTRLAVTMRSTGRQTAGYGETGKGQRAKGKGQTEHGRVRDEQAEERPEPLTL